MVEKPLIHPSVRFFGSMLLAVLVTFALFVLMVHLVQQHQGPITKPEPTPLIVAVFEPKQESTQTKPKPQPQPPKPVTPPPTQVPDVADDTIGTFVPNPLPKLGPIIVEQHFFGRQQEEARPLVRIPPKYPITAARDGIEGWVKLSFTITALGSVEDIQVLDAEPKRLFDQEAKRALLRWKYAPQMRDGKPAALGHQTVILHFNLEEG